jgi:hypothetical protein
LPFNVASSPPPPLPILHRILLTDWCQIGANVENADQCHKKLRTNAACRKNASPKLLGLPNYVLKTIAQGHFEKLLIDRLS